MISEETDRMTDFLVGASVAFGRSNDPHFHEKIGEAVTQLHDYIASLESQLADAQARLAGYEWIPVSERLPEDNEDVLVVIDSAFAPCGSVHVAYHKSECRQWTTEHGLYFHGNEYARVTHWMPLPSAPKEEE